MGWKFWKRKKEVEEKGIGYRQKPISQKKLIQAISKRESKEPTHNMKKPTLPPATEEKRKTQALLHAFANHQSVQGHKFELNDEGEILRAYFHVLHEDGNHYVIFATPMAGTIKFDVHMLSTPPSSSEEAFKRMNAQRWKYIIAKENAIFGPATNQNTQNLKEQYNLEKMLYHESEIYLLNFSGCSSSSRKRKSRSNKAPGGI